MNKRVWHLFLACTLALTAQAQVTIDLQMDQDQFLRDESLPVRIRISNSAGRPLHLGTQPEWLTFRLESDSGKEVGRTGDIPLVRNFELPPAKTATLRIDLMPYFDLDQTGYYRLTVKAEIPELNQEIASAPKNFHIISGTALWEREFGVPGTGTPEVRKFVLQQATLLKQLKLYARLTDSTGTRTLKVTPLGPLVTFSKPEAQLDRSSNLHALFQYGARAFYYCVVAPDGELIIRQTHEISRNPDSRPMLRPDAEGRVYVTGGQRRYVLSDLPPPKTLVSTNEPGTQK